MPLISDDNLSKTLMRVANLPGDFAEVGVLAGDTFKRLSLSALAAGRKAHAFDSFQGMAKPTDKDMGEYPEGLLSIGGIDCFKQIMDAANIPLEAYELHPGWIPDCFAGYKGSFSFALVDVDQYLPTVQALEWIGPRIEENGVLLLDDYFSYMNSLASLAIKEWRVKNQGWKVIDEIDNQLYLQKLGL
jgi:O-methyltransferase